MHEASLIVPALLLLQSSLSTARLAAAETEFDFREERQSREHEWQRMEEQVHAEE